VILRNAARCKVCGDTIESRARWDYRTCTCGAIFVDGGYDYLRYGCREDWQFESLSEVVEDEGECEKPSPNGWSWVDDQGVGLVMAT
jgi:hypothetical protein